MFKFYMLFLAQAIAPFVIANQLNLEANHVEDSDSSGYELRGFFGIGSTLEVSLRKKSDATSRWFKVGSKTNGLIVEKADAMNGFAIVILEKKKYVLRLARERVPLTEVEKVKDLLSKSELQKKIDLLLKEGLSEKIDVLITQAGKEVADAFPEWRNQDGSLNSQIEAAAIAQAERFNELKRKLHDPQFEELNRLMKIRERAARFVYDKMDKEMPEGRNVNVMSYEFQSLAVVEETRLINGAVIK